MKIDSQVFKLSAFIVGTIQKANYMRVTFQLVVITTIKNVEFFCC